jgi:hypothetical protein
MRLEHCVKTGADVDFFASRAAVAASAAFSASAASAAAAAASTALYISRSSHATIKSQARHTRSGGTWSAMGM